MAELAHDESMVRQEGKNFNYSLHNELRHLYSGLDRQADAMRQCDIIFAHSISDDYTLKLLANWKTDTAPIEAIQSLNTVAAQNKSMHSLWAACTIRSGELYARVGKPEFARICFQRVSSSDAQFPQQYRAIASKKLLEVPAK